MVQLTEMTQEEKRKMYNKLSKRELIEMLIEANRVIEKITPITVKPFTPNPFYNYPPIITEPSNPGDPFTTGTPLPPLPYTISSTDVIHD